MTVAVAVAIFAFSFGITYGLLLIMRGRWYKLGFEHGKRLTLAMREEEWALERKRYFAYWNQHIAKMLRFGAQSLADKPVTDEESN